MPIVYGMTLEQLRIFVAVARREHVSGAARELNLTQSAVSGALQALEARHRVRLFDRIGRGVRLNMAGRAFLAEAEAVLARAQAAETSLDDLSELRRGRLAIWATPTIANYWLPVHLVAFQKTYPGVALSLEIGDTASVAQATIEGQAELGFAGVASDEQALSADPIGRDQLVLVAPAGHPWGQRRTLTREEMLAEPWIMREPGSGARESLDEGLRGAGIASDAVTVALTLPSDEAVLSAVQAGGGVSALSESIALPAIEAERLARVSLALPGRLFYLLQRRNGYLTSAAKAFVGQLTKAIEAA